ncbi:MAG: hypothetical protein JWR87_1456, partial [Segetibacter sp.]|nr:hypothetical protein [Segetibacter sp.]
MPEKQPVENKKLVEYLEGPRSRWREYKFALTVFWQFVRATRTLHYVGPCI